MNKKVVVLSRHNFIKFVNSLTDKQKQEVAFISIRDFDHKIILNNASNVLNLQFDDSETEESWTNKLFDDEMAQQIIQFVNNNIDKNLFVVHCLMGQSRSGAVGGFLEDALDAASALDFYKSIDEEELGREIIKQNAGAAKVNVNVGATAKDTNE